MMLLFRLFIETKLQKCQNWRKNIISKSHGDLKKKSFSVVCCIFKGIFQPEIYI